MPTFDGAMIVLIVMGIAVIAVMGALLYFIIRLAMRPHDNQPPPPPADQDRP